MTDLFQALTLVKDLNDLLEDQEWISGASALHRKAEKMLEPRPLTLERMYEIAQKEDDIDTVIYIECAYTRSLYE